jgi:large subunit ribosomal protein L3
VQLGFERIKARNSTMPLIGHDWGGKKKDDAGNPVGPGIDPVRYHKEFRLRAEQLEGLELGQKLGVEVFEGTHFIDVIGTSKGKGHAGTIKRWNFKGQLATHGVERKHRSPGTINGRGTDLGGGRPKKGIKMAGQLGNERTTVRSIYLMSVDKDKGLLLVKGPVPGPNGRMLMIREAIRLYRPKAKKAGLVS